MFNLKTLLLTLAITTFSYNLYLHAGLNDYEWITEKNKINDNETDYEFLVYDTTSEEEEPIGTAEYTVYKNFNTKSLEEKKKLFLSEHEIQTDYDGFPLEQLESDTMIILSYLFVEPDYRKDGMGSRLFTKAITKFKEKHSKAVMFWKALPLGPDKAKPTLDKLCSFYNKNKGIMFYNNKDFALYYLPLKNIKKRTFNDLKQVDENNKENSTKTVCLNN